MTQFWMKSCPRMFLFFFILFESIYSVGQQRDAKMKAAVPAKPAPAIVQARRDYETRCSSCHGLDGRGGERAPNISSNPAIMTLRDRDVIRMVHDGRPSKGMPAFDYLGATQLKSMVNYLRAIGQESGWDLLVGNPVQGETLFFGKAGCGNCHMMSGKGGFLGSDLTKYAATHAPGEAREAILNPGKPRNRRQEMLAVITHDGKRISGVVLNEDNFSIQLMAEDGTFHNLMRSDLEQLERSGKPVMPTDYAQRLTGGELDDLVSYLAKSTRRAGHPLKRSGSRRNK
jgi:cytochrome c oxidase cbb3-type subunit III